MELMESAKTTERPVLVTTQYRGVFFGYTEDANADPLNLKRARLCIYWAADLRGFMGLAAMGPNKQCKLGPRAEISLRGITAVVEVSEEAAKRW